MRWKIAAGAAVVVVAALALSILLINGDDEADARETDGAFIAGMIAHHRSAIEMAEMASERAEHPPVRQLATNIIEAQNREIDQMQSIHDRIFGESLQGVADHGSLGLSDEMMGMSMDTSMLETARPFDRIFIDMMVPHHQGAIRMARIELEQGQDKELGKIADAIVAAQSREIAEMNSWRAAWYGAPSPAGGVPSEEETSAPSHEAMGH